MKNASALKQSFGLKNNYLSPFIALVLLLTSLCSHAQYDSTKQLLKVNIYGNLWNNGGFLGSLGIPNDTVKLSRSDSNHIAAKNGALYVWTGYRWQAPSVFTTTDSAVFITVTKLQDSLSTRLTNIYRSHDSVFACINGVCSFAFKDSVGTGGGGGSTNNPIGSGYKIAVGANAASIKSLFANYGIVLDSATAGQIGVKLDSATAYGKVRTTIADSLVKVVKYSDTSAMLANYINAVDTLGTGIKLYSGYGINQTGTLPTKTISVDSLNISTRAYAIKVADSMSISKVKYSDTASMLSPYVNATDTVGFYKTLQQIFSRQNGRATLTIDDTINIGGHILTIGYGGIDFRQSDTYYQNYIINGRVPTATGAKVIAFGDGALQNLTGAANSTIAIGVGALGSYPGTSGSLFGDIAIGTSSQGLNIDGEANLSAGHLSLYRNKHGNSNLALMISALENTESSNMMGIGVDAGLDNIDGTGDIYIGNFSGQHSKHGSGQTVVGYGALTLDTSKNWNSVFGWGGLSNLMGGEDNSYFGTTQGTTGRTAGSRNAEFGLLAGNGTGDENANFGWKAGTALTSANRTVNIGPAAGFYHTSGDGSIAIGPYVYHPSNTAAGQLNIGGLIFGTGGHSSTSLSNTFETGGKIAIGTNAPNSTFQVEGSLSLSYTAQTGTYSILATDYTIDCDGTFTATLPTAVGITGRQYVIKNTGTGTITVATTSSQTIDGSTTQAIAVQYDYLKVQSNGSNWIIIN